MSEPAEVVTWRALWLETAEVLGGRAAEARWLCEEAAGAVGAEWMDVLGEPVGGRAMARLDAMLARYRSGEPLQYVLGHWSFRRLDLMVDRRVLIPRPETEELVDLALIELRRLTAERAGRGGAARRLRVADIGTGSGAIALSIAAETPLGSVEVWGTDVSADALAVARANAAGLGRAAVAIRLAEGDLLAALPSDLVGTLDVVISNPPYVAEGDPDLEPIVGEWEPAAALFAGPDGLDAIRPLVSGVIRWLAPGGVLLVEFGSSQGAAVAELARAAGFAQVEVRTDLAGRDRMLVARASSSSG